MTLGLERLALWLLAAVFVAAGVADAATFVSVSRCSSCVELNPVARALSGGGLLWPLLFKVVATAYVLFVARAQRRPAATGALLAFGAVAWAAGAATNLVAVGAFGGVK